MDHGVKVATVLADSYSSQAGALQATNMNTVDRNITLAFSLGKLQLEVDLERFGKAKVDIDFR